ncbi:cyclase/dehydrase, partial [Nadsonia fulvescens var. elongata DSM 6958]
NISNIIASSQKEQIYTLRRIVRHPQSRLYQVVSDVESYSQFIPYCVESAITERDLQTSQPTRAKIKVSWKNIDEMYESKLTCIEPREVFVESLNLNLFKTLYTKWDLEPLKGKEDEMCLLKLELRFSFNNPLYNIATKSFGPAFTSVLLKAFEER